jgi:hypothetical protein
MSRSLKVELDRLGTFVFDEDPEIFLDVARYRSEDLRLTIKETPQCYSLTYETNLTSSKVSKVFSTIDNLIDNVKLIIDIHKINLEQSKAKTIIQGKQSNVVILDDIVKDCGIDRLERMVKLVRDVESITNQKLKDILLQKLIDITQLM